MDTSKDSEIIVKADDATIAPAVSADTPKTEASAASATLSFLNRMRESVVTSLMSALAARPRLSRVTVLAASMAVAAALGSMVGVWAATTFARPAAEPVPTLVASADKKAIEKLSTDIAALKAAIDGMAKNSSTQLARINERVERSEKAQGEPAAKIARLTDAVEKLERKTAAAPSSASAPAASSPAPAASSDITGSIAPKTQEAKIQEKPPVVTGWVIREVFDGAAMVESRYGLYEAVPGANLPGLGRVETIRRQDGRWVVVTPKGIITSSR